MARAGGDSTDRPGGIPAAGARLGRGAASAGAAGEGARELPVGTIVHTSSQHCPLRGGHGPTAGASLHRCLLPGPGGKGSIGAPVAQ